MNRIIRNTGFYLIIFLVTVGIVHFISNQNDQKELISYDVFRTELVNDNVEEITIKVDGYTYLITGKYRHPSKPEKKSFITRAPLVDKVVDMIEESKVSKEVVEKMEQDNVWITFCSCQYVIW